MALAHRVLAVAVVAPSLLTAKSSQATLNTNLIVNPGAESDVVTVSNGATNPSLTGWNRTGNLTPVKYGTSGFPGQTDPGPADRGLNFFAGGNNSRDSSATQTIDVQDEIARIDAGALNYELSGYFGGYDAQHDYAELTAQFRSADSAVLDTVTIGEENSGPRNNLTGLLFYHNAGAVPAGTRSVLLTLHMLGPDGASYNDGYADNLSFSFSSVPEVSTTILFGMGLAPLILHRRKSR